MHKILINMQIISSVHYGHFLCFYWTLKSLLPDGSQVESRTVFMFLFPTQMLQEYKLYYGLLTCLQAVSFYKNKSKKTQTQQNWGKPTAQQLYRFARQGQANGPLWTFPIILLPSRSLQFSQEGPLQWLSFSLHNYSTAEGGSLLASHKTKAWKCCGPQVER